MVYNTTTEREECRFCGLPERVQPPGDKHPDRCPEMPTATDVDRLKRHMRFNGYIIYEGE